MLVAKVTTIGGKEVRAKTVRSPRKTFKARKDLYHKNHSSECHLSIEMGLVSKKAK